MFRALKSQKLNLYYWGKRQKIATVPSSPMIMSNRKESGGGRQVPSRYLNSGYPGNRGIFPKAAHARTINAMMHFLGFPERVVADDRRHKYEASGCGSHK